MTEELLRRLYKIKKESNYLTKGEIIKKDYEWEMQCLNNGTLETYNYIWEEVVTTFIRTRRDVKKEFKVYNLKEYKRLYNSDNKYYDYYERLSKVYNKHICFIKLDKYDLFFTLEDLMEKLTQDGFNVDYRVTTGYGNLNLVLKDNIIDEYLDKAQHFMILKREN